MKAVLESWPSALCSLLDKLNAETYRVLWNAGEVHDYYCQRKVQQLLDDGAINFSSPCADLSALAGYHAANMGIEASFCLSLVERPMQHSKFQCNVELEFDQRTYVVGFSETAFHVFQGSVVKSRYRREVSRAKVEASKVGHRTFLENFLEKGLEEVHTIFHNYQIETDRHWHVRRNRSWRFHWTRARSRFKKGSTVYCQPKNWSKPS